MCLLPVELYHGGGKLLCPKEELCNIDRAVQFPRCLYQMEERYVAGLVSVVYWESFGFKSLLHVLLPP